MSPLTRYLLSVSESFAEPAPASVMLPLPAFDHGLFLRFADAEPSLAHRLTDARFRLSTEHCAALFEVEVATVPAMFEAWADFVATVEAQEGDA